AVMNRGSSSTYFHSSGITGNGHSPGGLSDEDVDSLRFELAKIEDEIHTLRQALLTKERYASEIRRQLGLGPLGNIKQNLTKGWQDVQTSAPYLTAAATLDDISHSSVYVRTRESLSQAGQVTSAALSSMGVAITRRLGEMRPSSTFRSFEEMVGNMKVGVSRQQITQPTLSLCIDRLVPI
uniref:Tpd52 like 2a n=1 Tax=Salarias fasciatus TaxID=181472 RepID=A0A672IK65_SALFA